MPLPRPLAGQLDSSIKTTIGLPNFPAYPSGHSTFSAAAAAVLSHLFPQGKAHGRRIGEHVVVFARADRVD
jgi:membrane-associated phospholipid phosphatase